MTEARWIRTGRGRLFAKVWRRGELSAGRDPVVLFHDSLGSVELWRDFPERLARATERAVVAYDRLGFGRSDPHPGRLELDFVRAEARDDFAALRGALGIEGFVAFGHSVGGGMAVAAAAAHPVDCSAVITESAQAFVERRTIDGIRAARSAFAQPGRVDRLGRYHGEKAAWVLDAWIGTWLAPAFAGWSLDAELARVRCPLLALHGDGDEYGSVAHPERIGALAAGPAAVMILPGCGHVPHREQPEVVLAAVREFLGRSGG